MTMHQKKRWRKCKTVHMIPTPSGWVEEESSDGGNKLRYRPAEKVEIEYQ